MASASYCALLHLPKPIHSHHLSSSSPARRRLLLLAPSSPKTAALAAAGRFGPETRASARPLLFETDEEGAAWSYEEDEDDGGDEEEEQEWAGGNGGAARGESGADAGEDLSGWTQRSPRPRDLFVCNLPRRCGVDDLIQLFSPYGTVLSVEISRDAETGISRGCGYVTMRSLAEAKTASNVLDGYDLEGREMFVKLASDVVSNRRNSSLSHTPPMKDHVFETPYKIYVGNLAWSVQPQDLREYFSQCGTVVSTRLLTDRKGGRSRVYGFLSFSSAEERDAALQLDNTIFHERDIVVREAHVNRMMR